MPRGAGADALIDIADPGELVGLELGLLDKIERRKGGGTCEDADFEPVLGRAVIDVIGEPQAAGAGKVDRQHRRIAGQIFADMAFEQAAIGVVAATRVEADVNLDRLALVISVAGAEGRLAGAG